MRIPTTRGLAVAVGLLVAALLVDAGATLYNIRDVATSVEWVSHTHEVLAKLEAVLSTLKDAETGQRGYLLTGEELAKPEMQPLPQRSADCLCLYSGHIHRPAILAP